MAEPTQVFVASELLSENEQTELKDLFLKFDGDHNGELDVNELSKMITHLQVIAPMEDLRALIAAVDVNLNGTIDCSELVGLIENTINETFSRWAVPGPSAAGWMAAKGEVSDLLSERESEELNSLFLKFDGDNNGELDVEELSKLVANLQVIANLDDLKALIDTVDEDHNGTIDCVELVGLISRTLSETFSSDEVMEAFNLIDEGGTGLINSVTMGKAMSNADVGISPEDIDYLFTVADESGDGEISYSEFRNIVLGF